MYLITNPIAGKGIAEAAFQTVTAALDAEKTPYTAVMTEYPGHAAVLAREAVERGEDRILVFGGDGTIREAAQGVVGTNAVLGIIPCGSGNDLARALHLSGDPLEALKVARGSSIRPMDACTANGKWYFNIGGFGFDVDVLNMTAEYMKKGVKGSKAYMKGLMTSLKKLTHRNTHITWTDEKGLKHEADYNLLILAACNGTHFGGGMEVGPKADPFDGMLDICAIHDVNRLNMWLVLPMFLKGKHLGLKQVEYFHATELTAVAEPASLIELDGEVQPGTPVTFRLEKEKLLVAVPQGQQQ